MLPLQTVYLLPWNCTPLMGLTTDLLPILGYHRKAYLLLTGIAGTVMYSRLLFHLCSPVPHQLAIQSVHITRR
jgi:hypothetical protein